MKTYLIEFTYDYYCQGYEDATIYILVYSLYFDDACDKIKEIYKNARDFKNRTLL